MKLLTTRHEKILEIARSDGRVLVGELARHFQVTTQTIRRDINELVEHNWLQRTHGGAILTANTHNTEYRARQGIARQAKVAIGRATAQLIPNQVSIIINIGTTTEQVAESLKQHQGLVAITNNLNVATILSSAAGVELVVTGGMVRKTDGGIVGEAAVDVIRQFKVDYAVIGTSAIDSDGTLLDFDYREVKVAQAILSQSRRRILVADASKFDRRAPVQIGNLADMDILVTDREPQAEILELCSNHGVQCVVANSPAAQE